ALPICTDNHLMLIDLRSKFPDLTGKVAEKILVSADITVNKNMVPFDSRSPFQTSGIRVGTPAITSRGLLEKDMPKAFFWEKYHYCRNGMAGKGSHSAFRGTDGTGAL
ncbi:MAG: hypothetical protein PHO18_03080, partial [Synergistaceae bacterium]|nr:hypothetical protein [Synergistaceae bacterium]